MSLIGRAWLFALFAVFALSPILHAQLASDVEPPPPILSPRTPNPRDEGLVLYTRALLQQNRHCMIEAARTLEQAVAVDPKAAVLQRALFPLYLGLERRDDALTVCRKALELDPEDAETWFLLAMQLRLQDHPRDALVALERGTASRRLKDRPELALQMFRDLAGLQESFHEYEKATISLTAAVVLLDDPEPLIDRGDFEASEINQYAADLYERLGRVCVQAKELDRAILAFEKASVKDPVRQHRLAYNLADVYLARNDVAEALACLDTYLQTQPPMTEAYEQKARLLRQLDREHEIVPGLEHYVECDPNNVSLRLLLGREYARAGQNDQASALFRELARQAPTPDIYRSWFALDREEGIPGVERLLGRLDDALAGASGEAQSANSTESATHARAMLTVLREDPGLVKALLPTVRKNVDRYGYQTRMLFGMLAQREHQLDLAERLYRGCLTSPGGGPPRDQPEAYAGLLRVLWLEHKHATIVEVCRHGLATPAAGNPVVFRVDLARALVLTGKTDEALSQANEAVATAGERERFHARRARALVLAQAERYEAAAAECQGLLDEAKEPAQVRDIRYTLSSVWSLGKQPARSEEQLRLILDKDANDATANNDLGYLWADQGRNLEEAEKMIRKALALDRDQHPAGETAEDNAAYLDSLGWVLFRRGQLEPARRELEKAVALPDGADDPTVWDHLGDVYQKLNDRTQAATAFQKAIELYETGRTRRLDEHYAQIKAKRKLLQSP